MPRGKKTSPEMVYKIMTSWVVTGNMKETANTLGLAVSTVDNIVKANKDKDEFVKLGNEKRENFSQNADRIIDKAMKRLEREIDNDECDIPINHLTTVIGTLYDKKALSEGDATQRVKIEFNLPEGVKEYAE